MMTKLQAPVINTQTYFWIVPLLAIAIWWWMRVWSLKFGD